MMSIKTLGLLIFVLSSLTSLSFSQFPNDDVTTSEAPEEGSGGPSSNNGTTVTSGSPATAHSDSTCSVARACDNGILIPAWYPVHDISSMDKTFRAIVYMITLVYLFLGVSIIADRFMAAIEVITSQERQVTIQKPNGETIIVHVRTWNETVSNLTLMALGSSAPEILLSIIECVGKGFKAGDLGPGTIVGSAAFNLFVILGLCVVVIPNGESRRIKHLRVFILTASWSVFAYLWLYIIISLSTPRVVDVWEGIVTFLFFPATVISAYVTDKKIFVDNFLSRRYRATLYGAVVVSAEGRGGENLELGEKDRRESMAVQSDDVELKEFEKTRKEYIEILRELRKKNPDVDMKKLEEMAAVEVMNRGPKSRAFYRIQATRKLTGGGNIIKKKAERQESGLVNVNLSSTDEAITRIFFEPGHYTVMENVGSFSVTVTRQGGNLNTTMYVDYRTEDGTANAGADYDYTEGSIVFFPGESQKQFTINIIDDDIFEEDEHFYVRLSNVRVDMEGAEATEKGRAQLVNPSMATVMILDDDHAGIFHFDLPETTFPESVGESSVRVVRSSGARGRVVVPYKTIEGTAKGNGNDYDDDEGEIIFENDETENFIKIHIVNKEEYEKHVSFDIELGKPWVVDPKTGEKIIIPDVVDEKSIQMMTEDERISCLGRPQLGEINKISCYISESIEFKGVVDKLLRKANMSLVVGTSSWREQFIEAVTVSPGDDDDEEEGDESEKSASGARNKAKCSEYIMHSLTFFWKVLFAFVPPTDILGGWAAFTVSIMIIGFLTALIGDIASHFGCTVGLLDSVTALSFVALGTSIPDTFASKVAAVNDKYADSSVGNVTGSNAVNVFLGIGIAWSIGAIYHAVNGTVFEVEPGSLGFSVTMFCCCAFVCILIMLLRRLPPVRGELGGPARFKYPTGCILFGLWLFYLLMSSMEAYCYIEGF